MKSVFHFSFFCLLLQFLFISAEAQNLDGQTFFISSPSNNRCLDVTASGTVNGTSVVLWDKHGGANQQWKLELVSVDVYIIRSVSSNKCFDTHAETLADNGTKLQIWQCLGNANQQWKFTRLVNGNYILNPLSAPQRALDADPATAGDNGTRLQLWDQHGRNNQQWKLDPVN